MKHVHASWGLSAPSIFDINAAYSKSISHHSCISAGNNQLYSASRQIKQVFMKLVNGFVMLRPDNEIAVSAKFGISRVFFRKGAAWRGFTNENLIVAFGKLFF